MKLHYYPETDSLYMDLHLFTSSDSKEISDGLVADSTTKVVSSVSTSSMHRESLDLSKIETEHLPLPISA